MICFADKDIQENLNYLKLLKIICGLSRLQSENNKPYLYYRFHENLFCKCFNAKDLSRLDIAYDAQINKLGIGLKTFTYDTNSSVEKVAEFNSLSNELRKYTNIEELANKLAKFRNLRIEYAKNFLGIENAVYHIVARTENKITIFETDYDFIDINNISKVKPTRAGISFFDGIHEYSFSSSKSTLFRKFDIPKNAFHKEIKIIDNPFSILLELEEHINAQKQHEAREHIVIPLYSIKKDKKIVHERSGLNAWKAEGRKRNIDEAYIPYSSDLRDKNPNFFPDKNTPFQLKTPDGEIFQAKICQGEKGKAIMSNPNKALGHWLLRKMLNLKEREVLTYQKLEQLGFDKVVIYKNDNLEYEIEMKAIDLEE